MRKLFLLPLLAISLVSCQTGSYTQLKANQVLTICFGANEVSYFKEEYSYLAYKEISKGISVEYRKESTKTKTNTFKGNTISWVVWEN